MIRLGFKETDSQKYRVYTIVFYTFIISMIGFAIMRMVGLDMWVLHTPTLEIGEIATSILMICLKSFDFVVISLVLSKLNILKVLPIAILAVLISYFIPIQVRFIFEICYLSFIFFKNSNDYKISKFYKTILCILGYSLFAMIGRGYPATSKFNVAWVLLSIIDYKMFLLSIYFYNKRKEVINYVDT